MKTLLKHAMLVIAFATLFFTTESCTKPEIAPTHTYRTRTEILANTWRVISYKINGEDITQQVLDYSETYKIDGTYSYTSTNLAGTGTWRFINNESEMVLNIKDSHNPQRLFITLLQEKQFHYSYLNGLDRHELELVSY